MDRIVPTLHRMAHLLFLKDGSFEEKTQTLPSGQVQYTLNIHESVWSLVLVLDLVFCGCKDQWIHKDVIPVEKFHLPALLLQRDKARQEGQLPPPVMAPEADLYLYNPHLNTH